MSRFLRALALVAPKAALARLHAQAVLRGYDAAQHGRRTQSFRKSAGSANTEIARALPALRERSSELIRNSPVGSRPITVLVGNVVGTDLTVRFDTGSDRADAQAQQLWDDWTDACDIESETNFTGLVELALRGALERGDAIVRMRDLFLDSRRPVPLALHVGEGDLIDEARDTTLLASGQSRARLGVELGENDERLGYWLHDAMPGEAMPGRLLHPRSRFVPRADVCHLYHRLRPGQVRGVPLLAPVLMSARDFADLMDALVVKEKMQAAIGLIVKSNDGAPNLPAKVSEDAADPSRRLTSISPGMVEYLRTGEDVYAFAPAGNSAFEPVAQAVLHLIASGAGVTYDELTGDTSRSNYTGLRQGKIAARRIISQMQWHMLVPQLIARVADRFVDRAIMAGRLRSRAGGYRRQYVMPAHEPIDPVKDLQADILAVRAGRMSPQDFIGAWGRDWRVVLAETEAFFAAADRGRMLFDIDGRNRTRTGAATADAHPSDSQQDGP